jgi:threonine dehydratase
MTSLATQTAPRQGALMEPRELLAAHARIAAHVHRTPLARSELLEGWLGHELRFKMECQQKSGSFKVRGATHALMLLKEQGRLPKSLVAFSSGNHAGAVAKVGRALGIDTTIIMPSFVSRVKQQATIGYGAKLILTQTRPEAEAQAAQLQARGACLVHPFDDDAVIAGQGTACLEALQDAAREGWVPDAVFAVCGGGGLLSGTWLAAQLLAPAAQVFGCEPLMGNDATRSFRSGTIEGFDATPMTIADGARTLRVAERTFAYLRNLADFYEVEEVDIIYWTQWMQHLLKASVEPTAAVPMAAAHRWLKSQAERKRVLIMVSGGNIDSKTHQAIWQQGFLDRIPGS